MVKNKGSTFVNAFGKNMMPVQMNVLSIVKRRFSYF